MDFSVYDVLLQLSGLTITGVNIDTEAVNIFCKRGEIVGQECPKCKSIVERKTPKYIRKIRDLNISGRAVYLHLESHQYLRECGSHFMEQFDFVEPGKSYTKRQSKWIIEMSRKQSYKEVGRLVEMNHKTVERICYRSVSKRVIDWTKIKRIGIDEFAFKKGHKNFITIIVDLDTHEIIDLLEYRDKDSLRAYFQGLGSKV
jgi:transposase